jgi:hypothetical protein
VPADAGPGLVLGKSGLLNPVDNEAGLETESEERADRAMEEPVRLGLPDDAMNSAL